MPEALRIESPMTVRDFEAFLDAQTGGARWELVAGRVVAMTDPNERHEKIASNLGARLTLAMDAIGCHTYRGGMGVRISDDPGGADRPRPDAVVRCGTVTERNFVTDPVVIAEVLSPSTMDYDRGEKSRFYKQLPTLRHIVLIYQDQMRVEHFRRAGDVWSWETLTQPEDDLLLDAVGFTVALERLYFAIEFANARTARRSGAANPC